MPPDERQDRLAPDQRPVALVVWMNRHRGIAKHGLGTDSGDHDAAASLHVVADRVERVCLAALLDLQVRGRRATARVPVDDVAVAIDPALLVELDEDLHDRTGVALVERKTLFGIVARGTKPLELLANG